MPLDSTTFDLKLRAPIATRMREIFGKDGEGWCKFDRENLKGQRCLVGAWQKATGASYAHIYDAAEAALRPAFQRAGMCPVGHDLADWNDAPERTFADISRVVDEIERMELAGEVR